MIAWAATALLVLLAVEAAGFFNVRWHWKGGEPLPYSPTRIAWGAAAMLIRLVIIWALRSYGMPHTVLDTALAIALTFLALLGPPRDLAYTMWGQSGDPDYPREPSEPAFRDWLLVWAWCTAWLLQTGLILLLARGGV